MHARQALDGGDTFVSAQQGLTDWHLCYSLRAETRVPTSNLRDRGRLEAAGPTVDHVRCPYTRQWLVAVSGDVSHVELSMS